MQQHWCYWEIRAATWGGLCGLPGLCWWFPAPAHYSRSNTMQKASGALWGWSRMLAPCFPLTSDLSGAQRLCVLCVQRVLGCTGPVMLGFLLAVLLCAACTILLRTSLLCFHTSSCIDACREATFISHSALQTQHNVLKGRYNHKRNIFLWSRD